MIPVRRHVFVKEGAPAVDLLVTPHLYSYKDRYGITFDTEAVENTQQALYAYADIFFLAAVNAWELDGKGTTEDFPYTRGDFHAWMVQDPKAFGDAVKFAIPALTGKTMPELLALQAKMQKDTEAEGDAADESKKKVPRSWIGRLLNRSL